MIELLPLPPLMLVETLRGVDETHLTREEPQVLHLQVDAKLSLCGRTVELTLNRSYEVFEASMIFHCGFCGTAPRTYLNSSCRECKAPGIQGVWYFDLCYPRGKGSPEDDTYDFDETPFPEDWRNSPIIDEAFAEILKSSSVDGLTATLAAAHYNSLCTDYLERAFSLAKQTFMGAQEFLTAWDGSATLNVPGEVNASSFEDA